MTELYQHPNSEQALCEQCVKDTMNYSAGLRLRDWMQVEDGKCGRCAAMPELDHEFIRANTSVRDGDTTYHAGRGVAHRLSLGRHRIRIRVGNYHGRNRRIVAAGGNGNVG